MKIKIVTGYYGDCIYKNILLENLQEYTTMNNYELISKFDNWEYSKRHPYWRKLELVMQNFHDCDYLLWIDADCMIIDMNRKLESLIDGSDFFITKEDCVQAGCFFIKNTKETSNFLKYWWDKGEISNHWETYQDYTNIPNNDNTVLTELLDNKEEFINFKYLSNMEFLTKHIHFNQNPNCFIVHIPGSTEEDKFTFMSNFKSEIKR
jgi:protein-tyrosine phosphatase